MKDEKSFSSSLGEMTLKRIYLKEKIIVLCAWLMLCGSSRAAPTELHFWPTPVIQHNPEEEGTLYGWPHLKVILQNKDAAGSYSPAAIDGLLAFRLNAMFLLSSESIFHTFYDESKAQWGFNIPGGSQLRTVNQEMLEPMLQSFVSCLSALSEPELSILEPVFYAPNSLISHNGTLMLDQELKDVVSKMTANYYTDRCSKSQTSVPNTIKNRSRSYLSALLLGIDNIVEVNHGTLLVLTSLYSELFFSANGLWVRVALSKIQELVSARLATLAPVIDDSWLEKNYSSFLDYILLTRNIQGFNKHHYLDLAEACGIKNISDIFRKFPLKEMLERKEISILHLSIGKTRSTIFVKGSSI